MISEYKKCQGFFILPATEKAETQPQTLSLKLMEKRVNPLQVLQTFRGTVRIPKNAIHITYYKKFRK